MLSCLFTCKFRKVNPFIKKRDVEIFPSRSATIKSSHQKARQVDVRDILFMRNLHLWNHETFSIYHPLIPFTFHNIFHELVWRILNFSHEEDKKKSGKNLLECKLNYKRRKSQTSLCLNICFWGNQ